MQWNLECKPVSMRSYPPINQFSRQVKSHLFVWFFEGLRPLLPFLPLPNSFFPSSSLLPTLPSPPCQAAHLNPARGFKEGCIADYLGENQLVFPFLSPFFPFPSPPVPPFPLLLFFPFSPLPSVSPIPWPNSSYGIWRSSAIEITWNCISKVPTENDFHQLQLTKRLCTPCKNPTHCNFTKSYYIPVLTKSYYVLCVAKHSILGPE